MGMPYQDTSFALKRYVQETDSPAARALLQGYPVPLFLPDFLEIEIVSALHGKVFRKELTDTELEL